MAWRAAPNIIAHMRTRTIMLHTSFTTRLLLLSVALALAVAPLLALLWNGSKPADAPGDVKRPATPAMLRIDTERGSLDGAVS